MASVEINMFKSAECLSDLAGVLRHSCLFERVYLDFNPLRPRLMIIFILSQTFIIILEVGAKHQLSANYVASPRFRSVCVDNFVMKCILSCVPLIYESSLEEMRFQQFDFHLVIRSIVMNSKSDLSALTLTMITLTMISDRHSCSGQWN